VTANPRTGWLASLEGEPRVTNAGRLALPVTLTVDGELIARIDLVLDGTQVADLHERFEHHLRGPAAQAASRSGNDAP
jgi:hypothetical protein